MSVEEGQAESTEFTGVREECGSPTEHPLGMLSNGEGSSRTEQRWGVGIGGLQLPRTGTEPKLSLLDAPAEHAELRLQCQIPPT